MVARAAGRKNRPVSSALRPRRYCEPRNSPARTARQQAQVHQGSRYGAFDDHEHAVQDDGGRDGQERAEIRPARVTALSMP
jgi:hypothetical protein